MLHTRHYRNYKKQYKAGFATDREKCLSAIINIEYHNILSVIKYCELRSALEWLMDAFYGADI